MLRTGRHLSRAYGGEDAFGDAGKGPRGGGRRVLGGGGASVARHAVLTLQRVYRGHLDRRAPALSLSHTLSVSIYLSLCEAPAGCALLRRVCVCVCVCVYVYVSVCMYVYTYVCVCVYIYMYYTHTHTHTDASLL